MNPPDPAALAILLPLAGAAAVPLAARSSRRSRDAAAVAFAIATAGATVATLLTMGDGKRISYPWIPSLGIELVLRVDALGATVAAIAGVLGATVVIYSLAYMDHAEAEGYSLARYYALVLLFIGAMVTLALADGLLLFYIAWELVGLCSFALISYYHRNPEARRAGIKALAVTRVGDVGLLVAVVALWSAGVVTFGDLGGTVLAPGMVTLAALGFLLAAAGKSAQAPLQVWLPDAMEAPTTVSALIHAATMVNAGIYLLARVQPSFAPVDWWPATLLAMGTATALMGAVGALAEGDLKRVLAYSTISQLGFMVAAVGAGALVASQFHLLAQALFKALLFLAAGAVIQAVGTRDLWAMGGLRAAMPLTRGAFLVGTLGLVGVPPFIGFWSKEYTLDEVFQQDHPAAFILLLLASALTALYGWRAYHLAFGGPAKDHAQARDPARPMALAMVALMAAVVFGGLLLGPYTAALARTAPRYAGEAMGMAAIAGSMVAWPGIAVAPALVGLALWLWLAPPRVLWREVRGGSRAALLVGSGFLLGALYDAIAAAIAAGARSLRRTQTGDLNVNLGAALVALVAVVVLLVLGVM